MHCGRDNARRPLRNQARFHAKEHKILTLQSSSSIDSSMLGPTCCKLKLKAWGGKGVLTVRSNFYFLFLGDITFWIHSRSHNLRVLSLPQFIGKQFVQASTAFHALLAGWQLSWKNKKVARLRGKTSPMPTLFNLSVEINMFIKPCSNYCKEVCHFYDLFNRQNVHWGWFTKPKYFNEAQSHLKTLFSSFIYYASLHI